MDTAEVEVVDCKTRGFEATKLASITAVSAPVQTFVVNGAEHVVRSEAVAVVCPHCGEPVQTFPAGTTEAAAVLAMSTDDPSELAKAIRCPQCGQPFRFMRPSPIEAEILN